MRSACGWAAWCRHSFTYAWGRSLNSPSSHNGVPSASVGTIVHAVKSVPMPTTWPGSIPAVGDGAPDSGAERLDVVLRILQRPVRRQDGAGHRQDAVDDTVAVRVHRRADFSAVLDAATTARAVNVPKSTPTTYRSGPSADIGRLPACSGRSAGAEPLPWIDLGLECRAPALRQTHVQGNAGVGRAIRGRRIRGLATHRHRLGAASRAAAGEMLHGARSGFGEGVAAGRQASAAGPDFPQSRIWRRLSGCCRRKARTFSTRARSRARSSRSRPRSAAR